MDEQQNCDRLSFFRQGYACFFGPVFLGQSPPRTHSFAYGHPEHMGASFFRLFSTPRTTMTTVNTMMTPATIQSIQFIISAFLQLSPKSLPPWNMINATVHATSV